MRPPRLAGCHRPETPSSKYQSREAPKSGSLHCYEQHRLQPSQSHRNVQTLQIKRRRLARKKTEREGTTRKGATISRFCKEWVIIDHQFTVTSHRIAEMMDGHEPVRDAAKVFESERECRDRVGDCVASTKRAKNTSVVESAAESLKVCRRGKSCCGFCAVVCLLGFSIVHLYQAQICVAGLVEWV